MCRQQKLLRRNKMKLGNIEHPFQYILCCGWKTERKFSPFSYRHFSLHCEAAGCRFSAIFQPSLRKKGSSIIKIYFEGRQRIIKIIRDDNFSLCGWKYNQKLINLLSRTYQFQFAAKADLNPSLNPFKLFLFHFIFHLFLLIHFKDLMSFI